jgi:hypothetical protein
LRKLLQLDWDIIAGITAAVLAIVLHLLHIVEHDVLLTIVLVLLALLLFRDLRRESHDEQVAENVKHTQTSIQDVKLALDPPEATCFDAEVASTDATDIGLVREEVLFTEASYGNSAKARR